MNPHCPGTPSWRSALLPLAVMLAACAAPVPVAEKATIVWPEPPDQPRIAFVKAFSRPEDLGITKGILDRIVELIAGRRDARLVRPMAVVTDDAGAIYVADPGARAVQRFDQAGGNHDLIRLGDDRPLPSPVGLARGRGGRVYVTDSALAGVYSIPRGSKVAVPVALRAELLQPTGIAADAETGRLYVADTQAHRVYIFNEDGTLQATIGRRGTGDGEFNYPTLLWLDPGRRLYVTDSMNFRVQVFDAGGRFLAKFGKQGNAGGDLARHKGVATDSFGHIYVVDALFHAVQIFDGDGGLLMSVGGLGHGAGEFWLPTGLYIGEGDTIYVADSYNQRVQVLRYVGGEG